MAKEWRRLKSARRKDALPSKVREAIERLSRDIAYYLLNKLNVM